MNLVFLKEHRRLLLLQIPAESIEGGFLKRLFSFLYRAFEATMPQDKSFNTGGKKTKNVIMWGAKDVLRVQLGRLLSSMLSDRQDFVHRVWVVAFIAGEPRMQEILRLLVNTPDWGNELAFHLYDLLKHHSGSLSQQQVEDGSRLINLLSSMRCEVWSPSAKLSAIELERLQERKKLMAEYWEGQAKDWFKKVMSLSRRHRQFDILATRLTESAMEVTQTVTQIQTSLRKRFIEYIRQKKTTGIQVKKQWQDVVQNLTHESMELGGLEISHIRGEEGHNGMALGGLEISHVRGKEVHSGMALRGLEISHMRGEEGHSGMALGG
ncbi:hypothetical protein DPMN_027760 [Dreissena polymorpha]|uniref:Uncharacterized protein n=1 Tax=Dreissena polymorpha TaxID=45954 RepID=A0A9D4RDY0_DREPO|nr:hypothetical protein DPMN_027760 [Dreissena polymorpha]